LFLRLLDLLLSFVLSAFVLLCFCSLLLSTFVKKVNGVITPTASHSSGALGAER